MRIPGPDRAAVHARAEVLARRVDRILAGILRDAVTRIGTSVVQAAGDPANTGAGAYGPASPDDLNVIIPAWIAALGTASGETGLMAAIRSEYNAAVYEQLVRAFTVLGFDLGTIPPLTLLSESAAARRYLREARNRLVGVGDTLWADARAELVNGLTAGESIPTLTRRISSLHGLASDRAQVIARTEVIGASNTGSIDAMRSTGLVSTKEWIAALDARTRPDHAEANGQIVPLSDAFDVGGASMDCPGDPNGPADEVVNCRCTLGYELTPEDET